MAAADHPEGRGGVEERRARGTVTVSLPALMRSGSAAPSRVRADPEEAVLGLEDDLDAGGM